MAFPDEPLRLGIGDEHVAEPAVHARDAARNAPGGLVRREPGFEIRGPTEVGEGRLTGEKPVEGVQANAFRKEYVDFRQAADVPGFSPAGVER